MNFVKLKTISAPKVEEYVIVNMDQIEKIFEWNGNLRICFNNKENNITVDGCEENRIELGLQIGNDLIGDGLCKHKK